MATQLVKWWKAKFQVGGCAYKTMTVLGSSLSDERPSDTEDLVKDDTLSYNNGAHVNLGLASSSSHTTSENIHNIHDIEYNTGTHNPAGLGVNFEDFECDVHVEETDSGEERKEFSFTFYDLDGYGKITKDDVAGLVRSIYGAVNDSIKVPQGGKKTIKVKLTVTPEKSGGFINNGLTDPLSPHGSPHPLPHLSSVLLDCKNNNLSANAMGNTQGNPSSKLTRNNVNVTIEENSVMNRESRSGSGRRGGCGFLDKPKFNSVRLPNSGGHTNYCKCSRNFCPEVFRDCGGASPLRNRKKWRERPCSLKRPDLLDLLQANMEKNNVSPCCRHISQVESSHLNSNTCSHHHTHNNHSQSPLITTSDPSVPLPLFANENFWKQKLADITHQMSNNSTNNNYLPHRCHHGKGHNVVTNNHHSHSHHHNSHQCKKTGGGGGHHRSRSHDLSQNVFRCHYVHSSSDPPPPPPVCCNNNTSPSGHHHEVNINPNLMNPESCTDLHGGCVLSSHHNHHQLSPRSKNTNMLQNANNSGGGGTNASPHQIKHRNREQEHARAMAQVISWLERENIGGKESNMKLRFASPKRKASPSSGSNDGEKQQVHLEEQKEQSSPPPPPGSTGSPSTAKKHEHHHVHEHIHHHYHHHYPKETPIIV